ncbi:hypothetical protein [Bacillus litorisediminis]|uniref:hypothetical protein n=1 Tax=Bacillus litorisediminis TaxID=2922713 RepID=UPI001FAE7B4E|nr:hypothetical protein [Bacillus litorisediminis]
MDQEVIRQKVNEWYETYNNDIYQYIFFMIGDHDRQKISFMILFFGLIIIICRLEAAVKKDGSFELQEILRLTSLEKGNQSRI